MDVAAARNELHNGDLFAQVSRKQAFRDHDVDAARDVDFKGRSDYERVQYTSRASNGYDRFYVCSLNVVRAGWFPPHESSPSCAKT